MTALRFGPFGGETPRTGPRLLPDHGATIARSVLLSSGEIRPMRGLRFVHQPAGGGPWLAVYRAEHNGDETWLAWETDVDVARAPLSSDVEPRYYWTGDGEPRYASYSGLSAPFALGIPAGKTSPVVTPDGSGSGTTVSRVYGYTFFSALGEESPMSPASVLATGKVDDVWAISGMDELPANSGTGAGVFASGVTTFTNTDSHYLRVGDPVVFGTQTVTVVDVLSATEFNVAGDVSALTDWDRAAPWNTVGMKRRLYRSAGTNATYQLVDDDVGTSFDDEVLDIDLPGDELISETWQPPPAGLRGIITLPNGALCGFVGNQLCFSEPYQPHAWPPEYQYQVDFEIVGIAAFGSTVVACTSANPYTFDGEDPGQMSPQKVNEVWPCLSKRSVVSAGDGVLYATGHGLAYVGVGSPRIWTQPLFAGEDWDAMQPGTMVAAAAQGRVFVSFTHPEVAPSIMLIHPGEDALLTELVIASTELYADPRDGKLYLVNAAGIHEWNARLGEFLRYTWRSKEVELAEPTNFGAAKIDFVSPATGADLVQAQNDYDAQVASNEAAISAGILGAYDSTLFDGIEINGDNILAPTSLDEVSVNFTLFAADQEKFSKHVLSDEPFRLPSGYKADTVAIQVSGAARIKAVKLGGTIQELKKV